MEEYKYGNEGYVYARDLKPVEIDRVLKDSDKLFSEKGIGYRSCYVDTVSENEVNYGLYLENDQQLERIKRAFRGTRIGMVADFRSKNGHYQPRQQEYKKVSPSWIGHEINKPHLHQGVLVKKGQNFEF